MANGNPVKIDRVGKTVACLQLDTVWDSLLEILYWELPMSTLCKDFNSKQFEAIRGSPNVSGCSQFTNRRLPSARFLLRWSSFPLCSSLLLLRSYSQPECTVWKYRCTGECLLRIAPLTIASFLEHLLLDSLLSKSEEPSLKRPLLRRSKGIKWPSN